MKKIYLVRHAKSSWDNPSLGDIDRPLNQRGRKSAPLMGHRLAERGVSVDLIISSPANRARSTAEYIASAIGYDIDAIEINNLIYFEGASTMLDVIQQTSEDIQSLMIVGHNPDMSSLFHTLSDSRGMDMPTCAVASLEFDGEWSELEQNSAELIEYDFPKNQR